MGKKRSQNRQEYGEALDILQVTEPKITVGLSKLRGENIVRISTTAVQDKAYEQDKDSKAKKCTKSHKIV